MSMINVVLYFYKILTLIHANAENTDMILDSLSIPAENTGLSPLISFFVSRPDFAAAWMNLGIVQNSLRKFDEAEQSYWNAIKFRKKYPDCYYNLGRLVSYLSVHLFV